MKFLINIFIACLLVIGCQAATITGNLYVPPLPDYRNVETWGARGDLTALATWQTTSNSTSISAVGASFSSTDIGKVVEIDSAGAYQNPSNQTLFAFISGVSSVSNITVSTVAQNTATNLHGIYGTHNSTPFSNCIAHLPAGSQTIIIPAGNYLLLPDDLPGLGLGYDGQFPYTSVKLKRGGITFAGQGSVTLTGCGGWWADANNAFRGILFSLFAPVTNGLPVTFTNLTLDGGILGMGGVGNINSQGASPADKHTGLGWDTTHHFLQTGNDYTLGFVNSIVLTGCTFQHWRGEMLQSSENSTTLILTVTNCLFNDGNATCVNNFAHNIDNCTFTNADFAEENSRATSLQPSHLFNNVITHMNRNGISLNGGFLSSHQLPDYLVAWNAFDNCPYVVETTPGPNFYFISNAVNNCAVGLGVGTTGYQGNGVNNSNIVVAFNHWTNVDVIASLVGLVEGPGVTNNINHFYLFSNTIVTSKAYLSGYADARNVHVFDNFGSGILSFGDQTLFITQWALETNNAYDLDPNTSQGQYSSLGNVGTGSYTFSAARGMRGNIVFYAGAGNTFTLDSSSPSKVPVGAAFILRNDAAFTFAIATGSTPVNITTGQTLTLFWNTDHWQSTP